MGIDCVLITDIGITYLDRLYVFDDQEIILENGKTYTLETRVVFSRSQFLDIINRLIKVTQENEEMSDMEKGRRMIFLNLAIENTSETNAIYTESEY